MARSRIRIKFKYPGASPASLRWSQLKEMVEAVGEAIHNSAPEVDVDEIVPIQVSPGSIAIEFQAPTRSGQVVRTLGRRQLDGVAPKLRQFAQRTKAQIYVAGPRSDWKEIDFKEPERGTIHRLHARSSYIAFLEDLGGEKPRVRLKLPNDEVMVARAHEDLIRRLGPHIYQDIRATLQLELDAKTGRVLSRVLTDFEPFTHVAAPVPEFASEPVAGLGYDSVADLLADREAS